MLPPAADRKPGAVAIALATREPELAAVRALLREYSAHLETFLSSASLCHRAEELSVTPESFLPPAGALLLATLAGEPLGCVGLRRVAALPHTSELCRLYVSPSTQGQGLGWALLQAALQAARGRGDRAVVLNTLEKHMEAAGRLYLRAGFQPTPPYKQVAIPGVVFYRLEL